MTVKSQRATVINAPNVVIGDTTIGDNTNFGSGTVVVKSVPPKLCCSPSPI